jgi:hypothetical protein
VTPEQIDRAFEIREAIAAGAAMVQAELDDYHARSPAGGRAVLTRIERHGVVGPGILEWHVYFKVIPGPDPFGVPWPRHPVVPDASPTPAEAAKRLCAELRMVATLAGHDNARISLTEVEQYTRAIEALIGGTEPAPRPFKDRRDTPCPQCGKFSRATTAGCDFCDHEDK